MSVVAFATAPAFFQQDGTRPHFREEERLRLSAGFKCQW
jgi:hypothetical protein